MVAAEMAFRPVMALEVPVDEDQELCALVHEHARFVFKVAYAVLRNHQDTEDAVQETFLRVMRHRRDLKEVRNARAWLARIAWRIAVDRARSTQSNRLLSSAEVITDELSVAEAGAEQMLISTQMLGIAEKLIAGLPSDFRDVLRLSSVDEMTSAEIAVVLAIPEATVRTRLARARKLLKEKMATLLGGKYYD
jgi:RNA polymerase sigma-70 factor (ECF subfamily)